MVALLSIAMLVARTGDYKNNEELSLLNHQQQVFQHHRAQWHITLRAHSAYSSAYILLHLPFCAGKGRYPRPVAGVATAKDLVPDDVRKKSTSYLLFSAPTLASSVGSGSATPSRRQSNGDVLGAMSVSLLSPRTVASCCRRITNFPESYKKRLQRLLNADEYNQTDRGTRYEQSQWQNINAGWHLRDFRLTMRRFPMSGNNDIE